MDSEMDREDFDGRRQSFGAAADLYDRIRPTYPSAVVPWLLGDPDGAVTVCDLGAGTGKLTEVLLRAGHRVVAVEPDDLMLDHLVARLGAHERLEARTGSAEHLPFDDASIDAVVAGQAWHWFDQAKATAEMARVLRPGGVAAAVWNSRDERVNWVAEWSRIAEEHKHPTGRKLLSSGDGPTFGPNFHDSEATTFRNGQVMAPQDLVTLAASRSYTLTLPDDQRAALLESIARLARTHPDLAGRERVELPYRVECHRARRR